jgi:hypothetical protein
MEKCGKRNQNGRASERKEGEDVQRTTEKFTLMILLSWSCRDQRPIQLL